MANTRYTAVVNQIIADVGTSREGIIDDIDRQLNWAAELWASSYDWNWLYEYAELTGKTESVSMDETTFGTGKAPRPNGLIVVATRVGSDDYIPLDYVPWEDIANSPKRYNRTATTSANQEVYTVKRDSGTYTLETFPYSYATGLLDYQITYIRKLPTIVSGANADDAFIWDSDHDMVIAHIAEIAIAHELQDDDMFRRAVALSNMEVNALLQAYGIPAGRLKLPALRELQQTVVRP